MLWFLCVNLDYFWDSELTINKTDFLQRDSIFHLKNSYSHVKKRFHFFRLLLNNVSKNKEILGVNFER